MTRRETVLRLGAGRFLLYFPKSLDAEILAGFGEATCNLAPAAKTGESPVNSLHY